MTLTDEEIRVKVAELMGWKLFPYVVINGIRKDIPTWIDPRMAMICTPDNPHAGCYAGKTPPDYLNDERAALQLCDRMHSEGYFESHEREPEGPYRVMFWMGGRSIRYSASDPSLARAVTLCFLKCHE